MVDRIHADEGSTSNILQLAVIQQMGLKTKINKSARSLIGFNGTTTVTLGTIDLDNYSLLVDQGSARSTPSPPPHIIKTAIQSLVSGVGQINSDQAMVRKCSA
ncbi:unnamed protein product [Prunus armeniaca]